MVPLWAMLEVTDVLASVAVAAGVSQALVVWGARLLVAGTFIVAAFVWLNLIPWSRLWSGVKWLMSPKIRQRVKEDALVAEALELWDEHGCDTYSSQKLAPYFEEGGDDS